jgi:hypothetical protein
MAKDKEPKRLCRCGCGKMLSARAERRHRDGQVPPRIAAAQMSQRQAAAGLGRLTESIKKTSRDVKVPASGHEQEDMSMDDEIFNRLRVPSPMDFASEDVATGILQEDVHEAPARRESPTIATIEPATAALSNSVANARAAVWTDWRAQREGVTVSSDEELADSSGELSEEELPGLITPEDDEDEDLDNEHDYQSVDDQVEVEWEKEWAEMGVLYFYVNVFYL